MTTNIKVSDANRLIEKRRARIEARIRKLEDELSGIEFERYEPGTMVMDMRDCRIGVVIDQSGLLRLNKFQNHGYADLGEDDWEHLERVLNVGPAK